MSRRSSKHPITLLLIILGEILLLAGGISMVPSISAASEAALEGTPSAFGSDALALRPTVTPPSFASQITPEPIFLPDNSTQVPKVPVSSVPVRSVPVRKPTPVDLAGYIPTRLVIPAIKLTRR